MLVVESDLCKLISFVSLMEGQVSAAALCAVCIKVACRMLKVRGACEQPWKGHVVMAAMVGFATLTRLRCFKERDGVRLLMFVVLRGLWDEIETVRLDAVTSKGVV